MDLSYADAHYTSIRVEDNSAGYIGFRLYREKSGSKEVAASLIFWDAAGQFFFDMPVNDVPLSIIEDLIREAKGLVV